MILYMISYICFYVILYNIPNFHQITESYKTQENISIIFRYKSKLTYINDLSFLMHVFLYSLKFLWYTSIILTINENTLSLKQLATHVIPSWWLPHGLAGGMGRWPGLGVFASLSVLIHLDDPEHQWALGMKWTLMSACHTPPPAPHSTWVSVPGQGWLANKVFSDLSLM